MTADPLLLLAVQIVLSFMVFGLLARALAAPLAAQPARRVLLGLLFVHAFRYLPLGLFAPGQTSPAISPSVLSTIALGDLASALLAVLSIALLLARARGALAAGWLFTVVSVVDILLALTVGLGQGVYRHPLGVSWYVLAVYVPLVCVTQVMIVAALRRAPTKETTSALGAHREAA